MPEPTISPSLTADAGEIDASTAMLASREASAPKVYRPETLRQKDRIGTGSLESRPSPRSEGLAEG